MSNTWNYITIEGYCLINIDYDMKKSKYSYLLEKDYTFKKVKNDHYDKNIKKPKTPAFCKERGNPCFNCMHSGCKHFSFTEPDGSLIIIDKGMIKEEFEGMID
jgi:hypothetical protein